jgi:serine/threonine-protein kinase
VSKRIVVTSGPDTGRTLDLPENSPLLIGRSKTTAHPLADPEVSRVHCKLEIAGSAVVVTDLNSTGGTFVNGKKIREHKLQEGDIIRLGATELRVEGGDEVTTFRGQVKSPLLQKASAAPVRSTAAQSTPPPPSSEPASAPQRIGNLADLAGQTISHYQLGDIIARGRNGIVFRATDARDARTVALKVLKPELMEKDVERRRFIRAMKTVLPLDHQNLVRVYGAGQKNAICWIAMEFVDGVNLMTMIQRMGVAGRLDWRYAFRLAHDIGQALAYIHDRSIVHRNIIPQNILVRSEDKVAKLNDLMLAKALEGTGAKQITNPGEVLGELAFLPPERTHGTTEEDIRSDIYSLGATLYAILTGRPPCDGGSTAKTVQLIREVDAQPPNQFQLATPGPISGMVMKMLAKRPEQRFQTPADLLEEVDRIARVLGSL